VARLAIAKGFLAEYAKLDKSVQSQVEAVFSKFAAHTQAGMHLEKLQHARDGRVRTIRIDAFWRGVVLAPESGDTFCLITVLPHDKANAYATSHRFSVNQVLGVMEIRDEAALDQLKPSLQTVAATAEKLLFADVSNADMKRLGVDEQIIPVVRLLTSESHLEALQHVLPEAQYTALYALACGMTADEAWAEVAQYLPVQAPPERVDQADLVTAMERTPGQVVFVSGHEELRRILAYPFAAWRIFLDPSQRKIAYQTSYNGPAQVTGGAGTGKTVTALHRAAYLAGRPDKPAVAGQQHHADGPPLLLTTFTRNLADALDSQLSLLIEDDDVRARIEVINVDRLAYRIVAQARGANPAIADNQQLHGRWATAAVTETGVAFTPEFLQHEWEQVILAQDLHTEQAYLTCLRAGRGTPLGKAQRTQVWRAAERVVGELQAAGQSTHIQLANEATHIVRESLRAPYRHVVVDEAQDLHPAQWRLLRAAVKEGPDDLFVVGDPHQRIYDNRVSLASLGVQVRGRSRRLRVNYRTTQEILAWAVPLLGAAPIIGLDGEADSLAGYRSPMHGRRPQVRGARDREEELKILSERLRSWIADGIEPHAIGVAARSTYLAKQAREALETAGIPAASLTAKGKKDAVRAGTMHGMKGLEFQAVAVIGVEDGMVPAPAAVTSADADPIAHEQDLQRERCVLFVACTRARDHLHVSYTGQPSPFLSTR
jgi:UvrD/REP helicase N-terminal domain/UvrD-like helicase C-terminal domain